MKKIKGTYTRLYEIAEKKRKEESMKKENKEKIIKAMEMVAEDVENDAREFDGKPFTGRTVAEYMGNHGAAIGAVAKAIKAILED